ncbi:MAG: hypothetical protein ACOVO2_18805 [Emticicia sp.]
MNKSIILAASLSLIINVNNIVIYFTGGKVENNNPLYLIMLFCSLIFTFKLPKNNWLTFLQILLILVALISIYIQYIKK